MHSKEIVIVGGGLTGSLFATLLAQKGNKVSLYEKIPDLRNSSPREGRSINLALSHRGWRALEKTSIKEEIHSIAIPMKGRMLHDSSGKLVFQSYGKSEQAIYSVSRNHLNQVLLNAAEQEGVEMHFSHRCKGVDLEENIVHVENMLTGETFKTTSDLLVGADGAFSAVRNAMQRTPQYNYSQAYIKYSYKELTIPADQNNDFALEPHVFHIWPRGKYLLIASPNTDKRFTGTLFLPLEGEYSFASLQSKECVNDFFHQSFPDVAKLMPELGEQFFQNPISTLVTVKCYPWSKYGKSLLIGDAAHAIVPFYGQGMNAGFEDCRIFLELMDKFKGDWKSLLKRFQELRKPNADAIYDLSLQNFIEIRDLVSSPKFLKRKKIESKLHEICPDKWIPLYSMVTFSDMPYSEALSMGKKQDQIMEGVMDKYEDTEFENIDFERIVEFINHFTLS